MKDMYVKGYSISDIAKTHGVTRQTVYKKKAKDKAAGVDWDALALAKSRDVTTIRKSEEEFILTLIDSFDRAFEEVKKQEPEKRLKILKEYSGAYYRLKAPLKTDVKAQVLSAVQNAINETEQSNDNIVVGLIISDENHFLFHTLLLFSFFAYFLASSLRCLLIPFEANTA